MPYYREYFLNSQAEQTLVSSLGTQSVFPVVWDDTTIVGRRSRPRKGVFFAKELSDRDVDPYAYFLAKSAETRYHERLAERGMTVKGEPDRGNAFSLSRYNLHSTASGSTVRRFTRSTGSPEVMWTYGNPIFRPSLSQVGLSFSTDPGLISFRSNPESNLETFAQQAYARTAPTAVVFDAAQFLGELREGLPSIPLSVLKNAPKKAVSGAGSEFLNIEFGWKPLINDLLNAGRALAGATDMLSGNGARVHRRYGVPTVRSQYEHRNSTPVSTTTNLGEYGSSRDYPEVRDLLGSSEGAAAGPMAKWYFLRTMERTQWFEGEFTNFFQLGFDPSSYLDRLNHLVNTKLTPSVLWELAPWSWLVDWHLRIGDTIAANELAANDRLVMHYGYAMEHTVLRDLVSMEFAGNLTSRPPSGSRYEYWTGLPDSATHVSTSEHKRRIRANPYGFRTGGTSALSQGQLSILGALGLTKLR